MADDRGSSSAGVLLAFLSGAALGAVAALLLTHRRDGSRASSCAAMPVAQRAIFATWPVRQAKRSRRSWGKGKEFVDSKKSVLREAFDVGREAMRRERERLSGEDRG
jgi:hypothetical protein